MRGNPPAAAAVDRKATERTRARYSRMARVYDAFETPIESRAMRGFRRQLLARVPAGRILEMGVGTGKNLEFYPDGADVAAIDISPAMLKRARARRATLSRTHPFRVELVEMDAQMLAFPDDTFDAITGTFIFCSVPDPVLGLSEARRVVKPGGRLLLVEHVRPGNPALGRLFDILNPVVRTLMGPNINRLTVENVRRAGWRITVEENLLSDIVKLIEAEPSK